MRLKSYIVSALIYCTLATSQSFASVSFEQALSDVQKVVLQYPGWVVMQASGDSMQPYYADQALVIVATVPYNKLKIGMIAVYRDPQGDYISHRIHRKDGAIWRCKGILNATEDPVALTPNNLLGAVVASIQVDPNLAAKASQRPPTVHCRRH